MARLIYAKDTEEWQKRQLRPFSDYAADISICYEKDGAGLWFYIDDFAEERAVIYTGEYRLPRVQAIVHDAVVLEGGEAVAWADIGLMTQKWAFENFHSTTPREVSSLEREWARTLVSRLPLGDSATAQVFNPRDPDDWQNFRCLRRAWLAMPPFAPSLPLLFPSATAPAIPEYVCEQTLFDDASVRKKLTVMSKWEAILDDARNTADSDTGEWFEPYLQLGRRYRVTLRIEDIGPAPVVEEETEEEYIT